MFLPHEKYKSQIDTKPKISQLLWRFNIIDGIYSNHWKTNFV